MIGIVHHESHPSGYQKPQAIPNNSYNMHRSKDVVMATFLRDPKVLEAESSQLKNHGIIHSRTPHTTQQNDHINYSTLTKQIQA